MTSAPPALGGPWRAALGLLAAIALGPAPTPAAAQAADAPAPTVAAPLPDPTPDRPVLVNRFDLEHGFDRLGADRGSRGAVYQLARTRERGRQALQLGYGLDGRLRIARFSLPLSPDGAATRQAVADGIRELAAVLRPDWRPAAADGDAGAPMHRALRAALPDSGLPGARATHRIATEDAEAPVVLRLYPERGLAVIDMRPARAAPRLLDATAVRRLFSDRTAHIRPEDGDALTVYHAPDNRLSVRAGETGTGRTGTWRIAPGGGYCTEVAPKAGWRCRYVARTGGGRYALISAVEGRATGRRVARLTFSAGNSAALFVARVRDVLSPALVETLTRGHSAERRGPDGPEARVFFRDDGTYAARWPDGRTARGRWTVLRDGRRCRLPDPPSSGTARCRYLRETDGGTFALVDEHGAKTGEVLIAEGNVHGL